VKKNAWLTIAAAAVIFLTGLAAMAQKLPEIKFEKYELPNGLDVILHEDHTLPVVAVNVWYHVGSKNEKPGRTGFAHLFEHMMFQGSEHNNTDYFLAIEKIGGQVNGSTAEDRTNYWENVPSNYLETALWLESDRMGYLVPAMTQERLDNQREVVKNERRQGLENQPYGRVEDYLRPLMFPPNHPYSWPVIGSMNDLSAASLDDVIEFFKKYYAPNNASLCIAGDFDPEQAKKLVKKYFASLPPGPDIERINDWVPQFEGTKRMSMEDNVSLPRLYMIWHTPAFYKPGDAEMDLLANALGAGKISRLYKTLVYEKQIAQDVAVFQESHEIGSLFQIIATARPGHTLEEIEKAINAELDKVLAFGLTPEELKLGQTAWEAAYVRGLERLGGFYGRADLLNQYNTFLGDPGRFQWDLDRYMNATVEGIHEYAKKYLAPNRMAVLYVIPRGNLSSTTEEVDRSQEPRAGAESDFKPPMIQKATLSNGMELYVVEDHKLPIVQANLLIKSGWAADPADAPGSGALTADLLDEGTKTRTALQISDEVRRLGANLNVSSGFDQSSVRLNVLTKNLDPGLELVADLAMNPAFPEKELERLRQTYLGRIAQESKDPEAMAFKAFYRALYGEDHPYAKPYTGSGTESSIKALKRENILDFYTANCCPNNAAMVMTGDITLADATARLEKVFRNWSPRDFAKTAIPEPQAPAKTKIYIVDKPGAVQSVTLVGHLGIPRNSPDFIPCLVMNNALGGQFTSRINMNLREDKGFTYGADSFFNNRKGIGAFVAEAPVQSQSTKETVVELLKEITDITGPRPLTDEEVAQSKDNIIKMYPQYFESITDVADQLGTIVINELPLDYWQEYIGKIRDVDAAAANGIAKKRLHPEAMIIVICGDRARIEAGLRELGLGEIATMETAEL
jgi:zinc protease